MIIPDIQNPIVFFSPYGYLEVDKTDYNNPEKTMIQFTRKKYRMWGTIKVK
jgi:hypothetical protein